ncbi:MAG: hypothetical protein U0232_04685 [Thermomicrobiales bacterium]
MAYRIGQFGRGLAPWVPARDRALAAAVLTGRQFAAFCSMAPADQRHAVRVARALVAEGARDPDLIVAGLLHDLGKVDPQGHGHVLVIHRVAKVVLARLSPGAWGWLSAVERPGFVRGCYLLQQHPALGAAWAADLGVSSRACALIAAHQEGTVGPDAADALVWLRRADDRA